MKNNINIKKMIAIVLIIILALTSNTYGASDSFKTNLTVDNSQVRRGQNITITIALSDIAIESGEKGIGAYSARIDFDSSVLEYVSTKGTDKWEAPFYKDSLITGNTNDAQVVKTNQDIGTIIFKVKDDAKLGDTTIKLVNFLGSTASSDVTSADTSIKVTIIEQNNDNGSGNTDEKENQNGNQGGSEGQGENGNSSGSGSTNGSSNGNQDLNGKNNQSGENTKNTNNVSSDNIKQGVLPKAGGTNKMICILACAFSLIAIIILIRIKLINKSIRKKL